MSEKKKLKQSIRAVWQSVKRLRAERAKLYAPTEIASSAHALAQSAAQLEDLGKQLSALNPMPPADQPKGKPRKSKRPKAAVEDAD